MPKFQSPELLGIYDQAGYADSWHESSLHKIIAYVDRLEARLAILEAQAAISQRIGPNGGGNLWNPV